MDTSNTVPRRAVNGDEVDVVSRKARHVIAALSKPGVTKKTKRRINKRERREGIAEIVDQEYADQDAYPRWRG